MDMYYMEHGVYPTMQGEDEDLEQPQPVPGSPHNIDFSKLVPNYLAKLPHFSYWYVDYEGNIYHEQDVLGKLGEEPNTIEVTSTYTYKQYKSASGKILGNDAVEIPLNKTGDIVTLGNDEWIVPIKTLKDGKKINLPALSIDFKGVIPHPEATGGDTDSEDEDEGEEVVNTPPVLTISMTPETGITDKTDILWNSEFSDVDGDTQAEIVWQVDSNEPQSTKPDGKFSVGEHIVKAKARDSSGEWSEEVIISFTVVGDGSIEHSISGYYSVMEDTGLPIGKDWGQAQTILNTSHKKTIKGTGPVGDTTDYEKRQHNFAGNRTANSRSYTLYFENVRTSGNGGVYNVYVSPTPTSTEAMYIKIQDNSIWVAGAVEHIPYSQGDNILLEADFDSNSAKLYIEHDGTQIIHDLTSTIVTLDWLGGTYGSSIYHTMLGVNGVETTFEVDKYTEGFFPIELKNVNLNKYSARIYVDANTGDDGTGNGSAENPYKSITKAIDSITVDSTAIVIAGGVYTETLQKVPGSYENREYAFVRSTPGKSYALIGDPNNVPRINLISGGSEAFLIQLEATNANEAYRYELYNLIIGFDASSQGLTGLISDIATDHRNTVVLNNIAIDYTNTIGSIFYSNAGKFGTTGLKQNVIINNSIIQAYRTAWVNGPIDVAMNNTIMIVYTGDANGKIGKIKANNLLAYTHSGGTYTANSGNCTGTYFNGNPQLDSNFKVTNPDFKYQHLGVQW